MASEAGHAPNRSYVDRDGNFHLNGAKLYDRNENDITHALESLAQLTPQVATGTATLTDAQTMGGVLVGTPSAVATYTTPTGTALQAAFELLGNAAALAVNDCFDLCIINLGSGGDIITLAGGDDVTIVGSATVDDAGADINSSGLFRFRYTAANTWVAYRIS